MKLSQNEKSLLFSSTEIPDMFFTEYLPEANGNFIKVYFYMLFLSKYNKIPRITSIMAVEYSMKPSNLGLKL